MRVPVADPARGNGLPGVDPFQAIDRVLRSGRYILGAEVEAFEAELAAYLGVQHCIGVASGTDALELCLRALGCEGGDEVVTSANAGFYASVAALTAGCTVRYADVDEESLLLTSATVEPVFTPATRCLVVTHLYGNPADVDALKRLCDECGVLLVEDCAQAIGARHGGRRAGSFGHAAAFSFYPTKNLGALGDGGAVVTDDESVAERARSLRQYGWEEKYRVRFAHGRNSRLDELQAAILRSKLPHLDSWNERRRAIVARYAGELRPAAGRFVFDARSSVGHLAVAVLADRDGARSALERRSIGTEVHYPVADHRQPVWRGQSERPALPVTEHAVAHVLTLPCFPELDEAEITHVCEALSAL